jgi:DNA repair exonuclease SbcCD nuclease subunit
MRASFIHIADTHLGNEQYGIHERFNDFSRVFWDIMQEAAEHPVNFVLIAGDLFHKRAIDARTLIHAIEGLKALKERAIPVLAIEGNHDRSYYREGVSWLQFLCHQGYLTLLDPRMQDGAPVLEPWNKNSMTGAYVDLPGGKLRIYGLKWQGAATARCMEGLTRALAEAYAAEQTSGIEYRLLMMHTGVDGIVPRLAGLPTQSQFEPLRQYIDYLALGHVHKPFEIGDWIYNPGSTETCGAEEANWENRGYYFVEVDTEAQAQRHCAMHRVSKRRPFVRHDLRVDGLNEPGELYTHLQTYCQREGPSHQAAQARPLVQIQLIGTLAFDASALDSKHMEEIVRTYFEPLHVRIDNNTNDRDYLPEHSEFDGRDRSTWQELERHIFEELVGRDNRYLFAREAWGSVLAQLKEMALEKQDPATIAQFLRERREKLL